MLCVPDEPGPATEQLLRPQRDMYRLSWPFEDGVEFHTGHGDLIDLLHAAGFEVERLVELYAPEGARTHEYYDTATPEWASKWPAEDLWAARKTRLTLASTSPQRRAILEQLRIPFEVVRSDVRRARSHPISSRPSSCACTRRERRTRFIRTVA